MSFEGAQGLNSMIRVMFLETSLRIGGTENVITQLVERLDPSRIQPMICCLYDRGVLGDRVLRAGIPVYHNLVKHRWDPSVGFRLAYLLQKERTDILFIVNQPLTQFWGTWSALLARVPVRITAIRSTGKINRIRRRFLINRLTFPWMTRVTALSQMHKAYLVEKEKIDRDKIEIVPNGVDLKRFSPNGNSRSLRLELGLPPSAPLVGIVAMLRPEKAHDVFLRAAERVLRQVAGTHFLIVGEGQERPSLEALARELGIAGQVHFLGARTDVPQLLNLFDVGVLSSRPVVETVSNAVLEYMAAAKPVVATRVGSLSEMVDDGITGFLVPPGDDDALASRIVELLRNPALVARMGEAGRKKVERQYTIEQMVRMTEDLFERLLNHTRENP